MMQTMTSADHARVQRVALDYLYAVRLALVCGLSPEGALSVGRYVLMTMPQR